MLASLCPEDDILLAAPVHNRQQLFDFAAQHLQLRFGLNPTEIVHQLEQREKLGSTGLGQGVAIPHARIPGLSVMRAIYIQPLQPILFDAPDGKPVGKFLFMVVPEHAGQQHLQQLADIARMFSQRPLRSALRAASGTKQVSQLLCEYAG